MFIIIITIIIIIIIIIISSSIEERDPQLVIASLKQENAELRAALAAGEDKHTQYIKIVYLLT